MQMRSICKMTTPHQEWRPYPVLILTGTVIRRMGDGPEVKCFSCLLQGVKASPKYPVNHNKLAAIEHSPQENPTSSIGRIGGTVMKCTNLDLKDSTGVIVLKDKFMAQEAPHVRRKLQKLGMGVTAPTEEMLKIASPIFYNRD